MLSLLVASAARPAENAGSIEGWVFTSTTGNYLNNARVTIDGTNVEAFTNSLALDATPKDPK